MRGQEYTPILLSSFFYLKGDNMANEIQESILKTIDYMVSKRIEKLQLDKTIVCKILYPENAVIGKYMVQYAGGCFSAYAQGNGEVFYEKNSSVYVLVPQNNFSNKKIILGVAASGDRQDYDTSEFSSVLSDYTIVGSNPISNIDEENSTFVLHSDYIAEMLALYKYDQDQSENKIAFNEEAFSTYIKNEEGINALQLEASFQTGLSTEKKDARRGEYGIIVTAAFKNKNNPEEIVYHNYVLDSPNMNGDPFRYTKDFYDQSIISPFDRESYQYIEGIYFYSKGFTKKDNPVAAFWTGGDIRVKDIELNLLKPIDEENGDYSLRLKTPAGTIFQEKDESLTLYGYLYYQRKTDLSTSTEWYWFKKDNSVTASSTDYNVWGGAHWKYFQGANNNKFTITEGNNKSYKTDYMLVAVYNQTIVLRKYFSVYNNTVWYRPQLTSDLGTVFSFDAGRPTITCDFVLSDSAASQGKTENDLLSLNKNNYKYIWGIQKGNNERYTFDLTEKDTFDKIQKLQANIENSQSGTNVTSLWGQKRDLENYLKILRTVSWEENTFTIETAGINQFATIVCSVYQVIDEENEFLVGEADITLTNTISEEVTDYSIYIINGDQVFQYNEYGVTPCSERYADPLQIESLGVKFYSPAGVEINSDNYSVSWRIPQSNTMIAIPQEVAENLKYNPSTQENDILFSEQCDFGIIDSYDYSSLDNQITVTIGYKVDGVLKEYSKDTTFLFTKVGENGTNGTDIVCKIDSSYSDSIGLPYIQKTPFDTKWCDGKKEESLSNCLAFSAYNRNKIIPDSLPISWKILSTKKGAKQRIGVTKSASEGGRNKATLSIEDNENGYNNLVVQGNTTIDGNSYYANYGIPIVEYTDLSGTNDTGYVKPFYVILDKYKTLKSVTYNADGRNPLYNKNQGIFIELKKLSEDNKLVNIEDTKYCLCKVSGGSLNSAVTAPMTITSEMETIQNQDTYTQELTYIQEEETSSIEKKEFYSLEEEVSYTYEEVVAEKAEALEALSNFQILQSKVLPDIYGYLKFKNNEPDFNTNIQNYKTKLISFETEKIVIIDDDENSLIEKAIEILDNLNNESGDNNNIKSSFEQIQLLITQINEGKYYIRIENEDENGNKTYKTYKLVEKDNEGNIQTGVREYTYNRLQVYKCEEGKLHFYLYPADVYTGEYNNNVVTITIMDTDYNIQAIITIPIYFSLNRYGLASLNAWDGNSLELNEEDGHILAPQIGAGVKNEDNTFTGIVMGKAKTYDQTEKEASVGLLGYSKGEQSIFLDANTGKAVFGLPEGQGENKKFTQGRIELIPNGVSKIGNWSIGSRDLYNITQPLEMRKYGIYTTKTTDENNNVIEQNVGYICKIKWNDNGEENTIEPNSSPENIAKFYNDGFYLMEYSENGPNTDNQYFVEIDEEQVEICLIQDIEWERVKKYFLRLNSNISYREENQYKDDTANKDNANNEDDASKWIIIDKEETDNRGQIGYKQVDMSTYTPYKEYRNAGNSKYFVQDANTTIPFDAQGIVLGANPPYLSVKGMPLTGANSDIDWTNANTSIKEGDSFEVELDPMKSSMFTIYRHYKHKEENEKDQYRRRPVVGINAMGQFYTNAVEDGDSSMGIGKVGAFGKGAIEEWFVGAQFGLKNSNILKFFIDNPDNLNNPDSSHGTSFDNSSLYITTGSDISSLKNEYARPIKIYGNSITLYGPKTGEFKTELQEGESEEETILENGKVTNNHFLLGEGNLELEITTEKIGQFYSNKLIIDEEGFKFSSDKDFNLKADKIKITENSEFYGLKINSDNNIIDLGDLNYNIAETRTGSNTDSKGRLIINNNSISFGNPYGFYFNSNKDGKTDIIGKGNSETNSLKIGAGSSPYQSYAEFKPGNNTNQSSFKITSGTGSLNSQKITINSTTTNNGIYIDGFAKASRYVWNPTKSLDAYMGISASNYTGQLTGIDKGDNKKKTNVYETIENALDGLQNRINVLWEALRAHQRNTSNPHHLKTSSSYLTTDTGLTVKTGSVTIPTHATIPSGMFCNDWDYVSSGKVIGYVTVDGTRHPVTASGDTMIGRIYLNKGSKSIDLGGSSSGGGTFVASVTLNEKSSTGITSA